MSIRENNENLDIRLYSSITCTGSNSIAGCVYCGVYRLVFAVS